MKKISCIFIILILCLSSFAQCDPATIKDMPSVYTKESAGSVKSAPEQEKWMTTIFASAIESAFKATKGLRGSWYARSSFPMTPEGFKHSEIGSYMLTMGCKGNKLYQKDEQGVVLNFDLNGFYGTEHGEIANVCRHEETKWKKFDDSKTIYIDDQFEGKQVYYLQQQTATKDYPNVAFYRKVSDGEYFVLTKPGVPLFIPLTRRQAQEINKKINSSKLEELQKLIAMPALQPETRADYEKRMAKDFSAYRSTLPNPEKFITDLIKQLEDLKPAMIKQQQYFIDSYAKSIKLVSDYLKNTSAGELDKPCIAANGFLFFTFDETEMASIASNFKDVESRKFGTYVIFNPKYFNMAVSKAAPQFIGIELRIQGGSAVALKAYKDFKANLNLDKLGSFLVK